MSYNVGSNWWSAVSSGFRVAFGQEDRATYAERNSNDVLQEYKTNKGSPDAYRTAVNRLHFVGAINQILNGCIGTATTRAQAFLDSQQSAAVAKR